MTDQSADIPNIQIAELEVLLGLLIGMWLRGYLKDQKWLTGSYITKATQHGWQTQKLETCSTL